MKNLFDDCKARQGTIIINVTRDGDWLVGYQYQQADGTTAFYGGKDPDYPTAVAQVLFQLPEDPQREISS